MNLHMPPCVLLQKNGAFKFLFVNVDDMSIFATSQEKEGWIVSRLQCVYNIRRLDNVDLFLGVL